MVATVPLFTLCFSRFFGIATRKLEWLGIAIGLAGIVMLNSGGNLNGNPWGALLILIGSLSWAFGSVADRHDGGGYRDARRRDRPVGLVMADR